MPKTVGNLFDTITSPENLDAAYLAARKGKRRQKEVARFSASRQENLNVIRKKITNKEWVPGKARRFTVFEPKWRDIQAPPFPDRVVHHALIRVVEPYFERKFIHHSYACRKGKGSQRAAWAVQKDLRDGEREWGKPYVVKCDISKYFASINHAILFREISRTISCKRTLGLWLRCTQGYGYTQGSGVPVGALTSQLDGNIVLNSLDHTITDDAGFGKYTRYMDDFVIVVPSKTVARALIGFIEAEVEKLGLKLNPKSCYFPASQGVDFAGYRIWSTHLLPRKRNIKKANRRFKIISRQYARGEVGLDYVQARVASFLGYTKHCRSRRTVEGVLGDLRLIRNHDGNRDRESRIKSGRSNYRRAA